MTEIKVSATAWNFNNSSVNESTLRPLCERVETYFQLPTDGHYRYFAATEDVFLASEIGLYYRGAQFPAYATDKVSLYVRQLLPVGAKNYDHLVYIRASTCLDPTGCVVTYAHELQHINQHSRFPKLMKATSVLRENLTTFEPSATEIDLPAEVDANIVSKRIAEDVCGVEAVIKFAEEQVRFMRSVGVAAQEVRWEFFLKTPSSTPYDFVNETLNLVEKYKGHMYFGMDVDAPDWWQGEDHMAGTW